MEITNFSNNELKKTGCGGNLQGLWLAAHDYQRIHSRCPRHPDCEGRVLV